ncbi:MAG: hypothetical protein QOK43_496 [Acidimicrobiaceae bacterium]|nr:hypothetical protein [Acidimicrobiaceae bacterium]
MSDGGPVDPFGPVDSGGPDNPEAGPALVLRPRLVWLVGCSAGAVLLAVTGGRGLWDWVNVALLGASAVHAAGAKVVVANGVVHSSGPFAPRRTVWLAALQYVRTNPQRLSFGDGDHGITITRWWWSGVPRLLAVLDGAARERGHGRSHAAGVGRGSVLPENLRSTVPSRTRWALVGMWAVVMVPVLGPISAASPQSYPGWVDLLATVAILGGWLAMAGMAAGLRRAVAASVVCAGAGVLASLADLRYAPRLVPAELALWGALVVAGELARRRAPGE